MSGLAVSGVEPGGVRLECREAGLGAQIDRAAAICNAWEVLRICVVEDPTAWRDEAWCARADQGRPR